MQAPSHELKCWLAGSYPGEQVVKDVTAFALVIKPGSLATPTVQYVNVQ